MPNQSSQQYKFDPKCLHDGTILLSDENRICTACGWQEQSEKENLIVIIGRYLGIKPNLDNNYLDTQTQSQVKKLADFILQERQQFIDQATEEAYKKGYIDGQLQESKTYTETQRHERKISDENKG